MAPYSKAVQVTLGTVAFMYCMLITQFLSIPIPQEEDTENASTNAEQRHLKSRMAILPTMAEKLNYSQLGVNRIQADIDYGTDDGITTDGGMESIDGQPLRLLLNQESICLVDEDNPGDPSLLVQVHSACTNKPQRDAVRETWGRLARGYSASPTHNRLVLIFLIGGCRTQGENRKVAQEAKLYRDIVQWDFADGYGNLTMKSIAGLMWARQFCPKSNFVLKADDDIYMNISLLMEYLNGSKASRTNMLIGYIYSNSTVMRHGLWGVSKELYPSAKYPPYCSGTAYLMSHDIVTKLLRTYRRSKLPILPVEDVFITGILAKESDITCSHVHHFPGWATTPTLSTLRNLLAGKVWGIHAVTYDRMYQIWKVIQSCRRCAHDQQEMMTWFQWMKNKQGLG